MGQQNLRRRVDVIIVFKTRDLEDLCNDDRLARKRLGAPCAKKLRARLDDLDGASSLEAVKTLPGKCHELRGDLDGCLAIVLHGGYRIVFRPDHDPVPVKDDGGLDWRAVARICVVGVEDYHD